MITVTTWADSGIVPDFNSGRWVQIGPANYFTFFLTGLPGGKFYFQKQFPYICYHRSQVTFENHKTMVICKTKLKFPSGFGLDGYVKGLLGQRQII